MDVLSKPQSAIRLHISVNSYALHVLMVRLSMAVKVFDSFNIHALTIYHWAQFTLSKIEKHFMTISNLWLFYYLYI